VADRYDAVVVGGGPNGLAAAVAVAQGGRSVLVVEAADEIGGGTRSAELTLPGFVNDVCSAVHPLGASSPFLASLPLHRYGLEWLHPELPLAHPLDGGRAGVLHRSAEETAEGFGEDADAYRRWILPLVRHWEVISDAVLHPLVRAPRHPVVMARFGALAAVPASTIARRVFKTDEGRATFGGCAGHAILPLHHLLTSSFGLILMASASAVGWPVAKGGSASIAHALADHGRDLGVEIQTGHLVKDLRELPPSRAVLFDLAPSQVASIAGDALPPRYRSRLRSFRHGRAAFKVDFALDGPVPWTNDACRRAGTVHVGGSLDDVAEAEAAVAAGRVADKPYVLVAQQSLVDATRAPAGKHTLWAYCHVPARSTVDMTDAIERQIERFAPGFRDLILAKHVATPAWFEEHNPSYIGGDIAGGSHGGLQLLLRPTAGRPYRTPNPRLLICSASTPPGAGVHGMCGYNAARAALRGPLR
jgi:phytoene dehydrogenase-like protein